MLFLIRSISKFRKVELFRFLKSSEDLQNLLDTFSTKLRIMFWASMIISSFLILKTAEKLSSVPLKSEIEWAVLGPK